MTRSRSDDAAPESFELMHPEGLLWALAGTVSDCVKVIDLDGRIVHWNAACEALYGWSADEVVGSRLPHIPEELRLRTLADIRSIAASGRPLEREADTVRRDGSRVVVRHFITPVHDRDGDPAGVMTVSREIALDSKAEERATEASALIARRLKAPLASLVSNARLLLRDEIGADTGRRRAIAESLARTAETSAGFLDMLAVTSEIRSGRLRPVLEPLELAQLVTDVASSHAVGRILVDFDPNLAPLVADHRLLEHAIGVLLYVAERVTPEDEQVAASVHSAGGSVLLEICDRGPRIEPEEAELLTASPYTGTDVRGEDGGSIGLEFAAGVAHAHGARFRIHPVTPKGARYTIEFDAALP